MKRPKLIWTESKDDDILKELDRIEREERILVQDHTELINKYDEKNEEVLQLLREKSEDLWDCKRYYDTALDLKEDNKTLKAEKSEKIQEISVLKRHFRDFMEQLVSANMIIPITNIKDAEGLKKYLEIMVYIDDDMIQKKKIMTAMKRLKVTKEEIEQECPEIYTSLKMKDW